MPRSIGKMRDLEYRGAANARARTGRTVVFRLRFQLTTGQAEAVARLRWRGAIWRASKRYFANGN
jgi:hypothetical protein